MSILDLRGPEFLQSYVTLLAGAVAIGFVLRRLMRGPSDEHPSWTPTLGALDVAYLSRGARGATDAAIAALAHRSVIRVRGAPAVLEAHAARPNDLTPIEDAIYTTVAGAAGGARVRDARSTAMPHAKALGRELERVEFVLSPGRHLAVRLAPAVLLLAVLALGVAKVFVGASRGRPVGFLILLCIATFFGIAFFIA